MSMMDRYVQISSAVDAEFARNRGIYGNKLQCRAGCSDCCSQLFQITEIEAARVSEGVKSLPSALRERLKGKAVPYLETRRKMITAEGEPESWGSLPPVGSRLPCPALEDGVCSIYEFRPLICRKFGIPLYNPDKPGQVFACELNFKAGDSIEDDELVEIQTEIHHAWKQVQTDYNDAGGYRDAEVITVARAILEDFSGLG